MNKKINIDVIVRSDCKLIAVDNSDYLGVDLSQYIMLEFLSYNTDENLLPESVKIRKELHNRGHYLSRFASEFTLNVDGTYSYYKLVVPQLMHFQDDKEPDKYINLIDELFFFNGDLYKSNITDQEGYTLDEVIESSEIIDYKEAYEFVQENKASQTFYCPIKNVFSVCKLQRCLVYLQRQLLLNNSKICNYDKCKTDENLRNRRDFLLSAMYVFDYLKDMGNFTEAQRILDNLSSCNSLCGEELGNINNSCGCGNSI